MFFFFFLMIRRPPSSTQGSSSAASDVYRDRLQTLLAHGIIPVIPPLGFDGEGRTYRVNSDGVAAVSYTHLRAHETVLDLVCRLLLEKKNHPYNQHD